LCGRKGWLFSFCVFARCDASVEVVTYQSYTLARFSCESTTKRPRQREKKQFTRTSPRSYFTTHSGLHRLVIRARVLVAPGHRGEGSLRDGVLCRGSTAVSVDAVLLLRRVGSPNWQHKGTSISRNVEPPAWLMLRPWENRLRSASALVNTRGDSHESSVMQPEEVVQPRS
jgi:hypothetical protein